MVSQSSNSKDGQKWEKLIKYQQLHANLLSDLQQNTVKTLVDLEDPEYAEM